MFIANVLLYSPKLLEKDLDTIISYYISHHGKASLASPTPPLPFLLLLHSAFGPPGGITAAYTAGVGAATIEGRTRDFISVLPELEPEPQHAFFNILTMIAATKPLVRIIALTPGSGTEALSGLSCSSGTWTSWSPTCPTTSSAPRRWTCSGASPPPTIA